MKKKILCVLLAVLMLVSLLPTMALATAPTAALNDYCGVWQGTDGDGNALSLNLTGIDTGDPGYCGCIRWERGDQVLRGQISNTNTPPGIPPGGVLFNKFFAQRQAMDIYRKLKYTVSVNTTQPHTIQT